MQLSYSQTFDTAIEGMLVDANSDEQVDTALAVENLDFGRAVFRSNDSAKPNSVHQPKRNSATAVFSADLVTSNSVAAVVNGVALTATVFATDHATTMAALGAKVVAALLALGITATATVGGASNRTLTIVAKDGHVLLSAFVVTLGGSQATVTLTNGTADTIANFLGITRHSQQPPRTDGTKGYATKDAVAVVRQGRVWCPVTATVLEGDAVYVDFTTGNEGKFTNVTTAPNVAIPRASFRKGAASGALAPVEVNLP